MAHSSGSQKVREWQRRMARFNRSPCSVTQFCQDEGVSVASFYHWRKKLQQPAQTSEKVNDSAASFTPVRVVASPNVTVRLPGGTQLDVPTVDRQVLQLTIQTVVQVDAQRMAGGEPC